MVLGRLASLAAQLLRGKGKSTYSPHMDQGDGVVVINASKIRLTGNKLTQKIDFRSSRYPGGQTYLHYGKLLEEKPERVIELAVYGMLPKNRRRDRFMRRLKVFRGADGAAVYGGAQSVDFRDPKLKSGGPYVVRRASAPSAGEKEPVS
ncbi:MAG: 50S ribosomal protein L13 [Elusimicrobiota bacterium]